MNIRFYNAKILTLNEQEQFEIIRGELWVNGDSIRYVGESKKPAEICAELKLEMPVWEREIDVKGNLLMPGFKNAHAHTYMTFLRSYADDLPLQEWLYQMCFPKEDKLDTENIRPLEVLGIMEYLTSGITTSFDMCYFPPVYAQVAAQCGFRAVQVSGVNSFGGSAAVVEENYLKVNETSDLTSFMIGFHAEYTTKMDLMKEIADLAHKYKSPVFLHNSETQIEVKVCLERYGKTPTQLTEELGMSRNPVRTALKMLQSEGLIVTDYYKSMTVKEITDKDINELYQLRELLEGSAFKLIFESGKAEEYSYRIEEKVVHMCAVASDVYEWELADTQMHLEIVSIFNNDRITKFYESNLSELVRVGMYSLKNGMRIVPTNENLKKMVKYMRKNDYERAFAILKKDHFMQGKDSAMKEEQKNG